MKTVFMSLIALFMTLPAMARTVGSSDADLIKQKISERQTKYELKSKLDLKAPAAITLIDTKAAAPAQSVNKSSHLNSEGGWQPEINDVSGNTSIVLEAIRLLADQKCSSSYIAEGMATLLSEEFAGANVDISSLSEDVKSCLSR